LLLETGVGGELERRHLVDVLHHALQFRLDLPLVLLELCARSALALNSLLDLVERLLQLLLLTVVAGDLALGCLKILHQLAVNL
ncbi:hypothetical protein PFISCL1PPCAC_5214, partial [Pristionchus fissidentatus]